MTTSKLKQHREGWPPHRGLNRNACWQKKLVARNSLLTKKFHRLPIPETKYPGLKYASMKRCECNVSRYSLLGGMNLLSFSAQKVRSHSAIPASSQCQVHESLAIRGAPIMSLSSGMNRKRSAHMGPKLRLTVKFLGTVAPIPHIMNTRI
jgi:hypothetical protein